VNWISDAMNSAYGDTLQYNNIYEDINFVLDILIVGVRCPKYGTAVYCDAVDTFSILHVLNTSNI